VSLDPFLEGHGHAMLTDVSPQSSPVRVISSSIRACLGRINISRFSADNSRFILYHPIYYAGLYLASKGHEGTSACIIGLKQYALPFPQVWESAQKIQVIYLAALPAGERMVGAADLGLPDIQVEMQGGTVLPGMGVSGGAGYGSETDGQLQNHTAPVYGDFDLSYAWTRPVSLLVGANFGDEDK
jgi:hypothetical protein